jgi:hypothetical protein
LPPFFLVGSGSPVLESGQTLTVRSAPRSLPIQPYAHLPRAFLAADQKRTEFMQAVRDQMDVGKTPVLACSGGGDITFFQNEVT